ncbi:hypothetical protein L6164_007603 [Bauhinia variegata]|uniref:Uncharacterized protein n=1 Tax=Bauhinia variegata TaxID=167791 RepID=A0ACB9PEA2_BAUVA|nr:hypothetical protein L6164_007603 [Bauhinia variegata]
MLLRLRTLHPELLRGRLSENVLAGGDHEQHEEVQQWVSKTTMSSSLSGKVYMGRRKCTGQTVAMKFIMKHGKSEKDVHNLRQEIEILRRLKHDNIIQMLDSFESPQEFCVVTEFAQGELFEILEDDQCLPEEQVQAIAKQLVRALHYLHSNRIIHRDMKPQNIPIGTGSVVKLCDFGFARAMSTNTVALQSIKGTPLYMAPELALARWCYSDPVKYPKNMTAHFKSFLKGLLSKTPESRLTWPALLEHPFVKETVDVLESGEMREIAGSPGGLEAAWRGERKNIQTKTPQVASSPACTYSIKILIFIHYDFSYLFMMIYVVKGKGNYTAAAEESIASPLQSEAQLNGPKAHNESPIRNCVEEPGRQRLDRLENNSRTVKGAKIIGRDNEALTHILLPLKRWSKRSQNFSRRKLFNGFYEYIKGASIMEFLKDFLSHEDPNIRAKACSTMGNMCRYNDYFYSSLARHQIISILIDRCTDPDKETRKYACFAIGNAAFHKDMLYDELRRSIPRLSNLLLNPEEEERTKEKCCSIGTGLKQKGFRKDVSARTLQRVPALIRVVSCDWTPSAVPRIINISSCVCNCEQSC